MKNLLIAANWKSHMTSQDARKWIEHFSLRDNPEDIEVVLLAPFTLLDLLSKYIKVNDLPIHLGAQDISPFDTGAFTGEVNEVQIKEFCSYVLIGHSERRLNFKEDDEMINKKIERAQAAGLKIIVCVSDLDQVKSLKSENITIAYEPLDAIGTGNAQDPQDVLNFVNQIKEIKNVNVIYGGSVNAENVKNYISLDNIGGALVGSESLVANSFSDILINAI